MVCSIKSPLCVTYNTTVKEHTAIDAATTPCEAASALSASDTLRSSAHPTALVYGQSITDACISWTQTEALLEDLAAAARRRRGRTREARSAV